jgi:hypothetical protein
MIASVDGSAILSLHPTDPVAFVSWPRWLGPAFSVGLCQILSILVLL